MYDSEKIRAAAQEINASYSPPTAAMERAFRAEVTPIAVLSMLDEIERLRKDAERYRWIKSKKEDFDNMAGASCHATKLSNILKRRDDWDAAIDAARTQGGDA